MSQMARILVGLACLATPTLANGRADEPSNDFKIRVAAYGIRKEPISTEELVVISGRVYQFATETNEVVIIEPARSRIDLLDIKRRLQSEVTFEELEEGLTRVKSMLAGSIDRLEKTGKRSDAVESAMTRDLIDPRFKVSFEPKTSRVLLANPTVEVTADGEPDPNPTRLNLVDKALVAIAKLGAFRAPNDLPPFVELEAIAALTGERKLRPTELSYLYRLTGPPKRFRRTYRLVDGLTDRDREAIRRIDQLREVVPSIRYEKYRGDR